MEHGRWFFEGVKKEKKKFIVDTHLFLWGGNDWVRKLALTVFWENLVVTISMKEKMSQSKLNQKWKRKVCEL